MMNDALNLFSIDVDAAVRKLTDRRYKASFESVLDLIRLAAGWGPTSIRVSLRRGRVAVVATEVQTKEGVFELVERIFRTDLSSEERQRALAELERTYGLFVLGAFSKGPADVTIEWPGEVGMRGLRFAPGRPPVRYTPETLSDWTITVKRYFGGKQERRSVEQRCRFASVPIFVNDTLISRGKRIEQSLLHVDVAMGAMNGVVGLPEEGDVSRITRLVRGIIDEELVLPITSGLVYHAVVEDSADAWDETKGVLRAAGRTLYRALAERYTGLDEKGRKRAEALLFDRFSHTRRPELLKGVTAFTRVGGPPVDLPGIQAQTGRIELYAIDGDAAVAQYVLSNRFVLLLDKKQRQFLESVLKVPLMEPPRRAELHSLKERVRSLSRQTSTFVKQLIFRPGRPIETRHLDETERNFLQILESEIRAGAYCLPGVNEGSDIALAMANGGRLPWTRFARASGGLVYRIPRAHPMVQSMVRAVAADPAYRYPALVVLSAGAIRRRYL